MARFGLELLDLITVSNEHGDFDVGKGALTISLAVTDPSLWQPTKSNDSKWNEASREMIQVRLCLFFHILSNLSLPFHILHQN